MPGTVTITREPFDAARRRLWDQMWDELLMGSESQGRRLADEPVVSGSDPVNRRMTVARRSEVTSGQKSA